LGLPVLLLRRGFKTWCENAAGGYRRDLNLPRHSALDPRLLALHINVIIWKTIEVPGLDPKVLNHLTKVDAESWSAVTLRLPTANLIVINDAHVIGRQNNSLAHELAHIILKHEPSQVFVTADGVMMMADYNKTNEDEADCLAGTLLVPREALLNLLDRGYSDEQLAEFFGVTTDLVRMRKNLTGVNIQRSRRGARA
jgi:Zn-dependent peptidase ImmA (M78 family)